MVFTIFCCGTCSNRYDAYGGLERDPDEWDNVKGTKIYTTFEASSFEELYTQAVVVRNPEAKKVYEEVIAKRRKNIRNDHRYFEGEIVSTLAERHRGREFVNWMICDGPGSGRYQEKLLWTKTYGYSDGRGVATGAGMDENVRHAIAMIKNNFDPSLYAPDPVYDPDTGEQVGETPAPIMNHGLKKVSTGFFSSKMEPTSSRSSITPQMLQQEIIRRGRRGQAPYISPGDLKKSGKPAPKGRPLMVTRVNLIGWSRGAVTCLMIANAIAEDEALKNIPVNIFAVDPVPGGLNQQFYKSMTSLPGCVKNYFGVYARDEVSRNFSAVLPKVEKSTKVTVVPLPGAHGTVAGSDFLDKNAKVNSEFNLRGPGRITRYWAERSLCEWGSEIQKQSNYTPVALYNMYEQIAANDAEFRKMRGYAYVGMRQGYFGTRRDLYWDGSGYLSNYWTFDELAGKVGQMRMCFKDESIGGDKVFVNWHHLALHKRLFD
jgi:hypothetical protein